MVRIELPDPVPVIEMGLALKLELVQRGRPLRLRVTLPVNPPDGVTTMLSVLLELTATLIVPAEATRSKLGGGPEELTTNVTLVEECRLPFVPVTVML